MALNRTHNIPLPPSLCLLFGLELALIFAFHFFFFWLDKIKCDTKEETKGVNICTVQYGLCIFATGKSEHISRRISAYWILCERERVPLVVL